MDNNEVNECDNTKDSFNDDKEGSGNQEHDDDDNGDDDDGDDDESDSDVSEDCIVKILIGIDEQEFFVSKNTICRQAGYFNDVISTDYLQDDKDIVVRLPGMLPKPFRTYLHWVEHREVIPELWPGCAEEDLAEEMELQAWMFMYVLADEHFFDPELKTHAMEFLIAEHASWSSVPGGEFTTHFWRHTYEDSHLRTFMVEWIFHRYAGFTKYARFARDALTYPKSSESSSQSWRPKGVFLRTALFPTRRVIRHSAMQCERSCWSVMSLTAWILISSEGQEICA